MIPTGLIDKIVDALNLVDSNPKETSALHRTLHNDEDGDDYETDFNYTSVLCIPLYLQ